MSAERPDATLEELLEFIKDTRGFDFTGYKRSTIQRRVAKRMATAGVERHDDYIDYLELHGEEFAELFNTLLINTTGFFRDPQTWEYMATEVGPPLLAARSAEEPIRVWSAGCASGEEPYTVAMVLARVMGDVAFRERVKIYATDIDEEALDFARYGAYAPRQIEDLPHDALERFFERTDQRYVFRKDLRRSVIFGRNDSCRMRRSRASTCSYAATRLCTSRPRPSRRSCVASTLPSTMRAISCSASPRC